MPGTTGLISCPHAVPSQAHPPRSSPNQPIFIAMLMLLMWLLLFKTLNAQVHYQPSSARWYSRLTLPLPLPQCLVPWRPSKAPSMVYMAACGSWLFFLCKANQVRFLLKPNCSTPEKTHTHRGPLKPPSFPRLQAGLVSGFQ